MSKVPVSKIRIRLKKFGFNGRDRADHGKDKLVQLSPTLRDLRTANRRQQNLHLFMQRWCGRPPRPRNPILFKLNRHAMHIAQFARRSSMPSFHCQWTIMDRYRITLLSTYHMKFVTVLDWAPSRWLRILRLRIPMSAGLAICRVQFHIIR